MPRTVTRVDLDALLTALVAPRPVDDTDDRILDAASRELLRHGLEAFEVDAVAAASGVGRSTVYRRFDGRNGLIVAALAREGRRFLAALAGAVAPIDDLQEQVVAAFAAGLRLARDGAFASMLREEPMLLRLLTVDGAPIVAAAREQLVAEARHRGLSVDIDQASATAEVLIRLAVSFVLLPESALDLRDEAIEASVRRHIAPLLTG